MSLSLEEITKLRKEKYKSIVNFFFCFTLSFLLTVAAIITKWPFEVELLIAVFGGILFSLGAKNLCEAIVASCRLGPFVEE